jgi:hypothetical protein
MSGPPAASTDLDRGPTRSQGDLDINKGVNQPLPLMALEHWRLLLAGACVLGYWIVRGRDSTEGLLFVVVALLATVKSKRFNVAILVAGFLLVAMGVSLSLLSETEQSLRHLLQILGYGLTFTLLRC